VAFCLYVFGGDPPTSMMSPGSVTFQHSALEDNCAICHVAAEKDPKSFASFAFEAHTAFADSQKCIKCHTEIGPNPLLAHGVARDVLLHEHSSAADNGDAFVNTGRPAGLTMAAMWKTSTPDEELACATCHREHHGKEHDLTKLANEQCQSCHQKQFHSFSNGHPELSDFAYSRRPRIYFDHARHLQQYFVEGEHRRMFPDAKTPEACVACHVPDPTGSVIQTRGFAQMCAACHEAEIKDRDFPGLPFIAVPQFALDESTSADDAPKVGVWPPATGSLPASRMPAFMRLLLESDTNWTPAIRNARDLSTIAVRSPESVADGLWAIKTLFADLSRHGDAELQKRLSDRYPELASIEPSLIPSVVSATSRWFPNLPAELEARARGAELPEAQAGLATFRNPDDAVLGGGWYVQDTDHTIRYRPAGHADRLMKSLLDATVKTLGSESDEHAAEVLAILASPTASGSPASAEPVASGRCLQCHTVDRDLNSGALRVNWYARIAGQNETRLTAFSHAPHMQLPTKGGCLSCHRVSEELPSDSFRESFFSRATLTGEWHPVTDWHVAGVSGFDRLEKAHCASCHTPNSAGDSCLTCHSYHANTAIGHVNDFWRAASSLDRVPRPAKPQQSGD
jgi:hypothetical protein